MNSHKKAITAGLIGNPNTGKTSLLNSLAGLSLHVGNWPGKTVEKKEGKVHFMGYKIKIVDLPGTYSIAPYSEEERISRAFIVEQNPDVIVQIVDVTALERNLLMTLELLAMGKNIILAFNFNKEAEKRGIKIAVDKIRRALQIPIVQIEANTGENKEELLKEIIHASQHKLAAPEYLKPLLKNDEEIYHDKTLSFIKETLSPFYSTDRQTNRTREIDSFLLNKYTAFPIFLFVMFLMFDATFTLSAPLIGLVDILLERLGGLVQMLDPPALLTSFLVEGVISGVGFVLAFAPLIFVLFLLITLLEDSGYLARTVVLVDQLFSGFGISGRTFIPMILGFGCNVPAVMATRTIRDRKERLIAIFINPFMSCSARLPVYLLFTGIFFPDHARYVIMLLYLFGVFIALVSSLVLSKIFKASEENTLIIELPPYRVPTTLNVIKHAWYQTTIFIRKAGTVILISVIVIWFLASLPLGVVYGSEGSVIGRIGRWLAPLFGPLGFGYWTFAVALLFGLIAKEVVIGTLGTLYGVGKEGLNVALASHISPLGALSFLFFVLLYVPCLATVATVKKETGSKMFVATQVVVTILIAWLVSFAVYNGGQLLGFAPR